VLRGRLGQDEGVGGLGQSRAERPSRRRFPSDELEEGPNTVGSVFAFRRQCSERRLGVIWVGRYPLKERVSCLPVRDIGVLVPTATPEGIQPAISSVQDDGIRYSNLFDRFELVIRS
jgi:hypothetical protein